MGYGWRDNDLLLEHKGVEVYYIYKDDDQDNGITRTYWYGLTPYASDCGSDNGEFDVRQLSTFDFKRKYTWGEEFEVIKQAIIAAIDKGELKPWDG